MKKNSLISYVLSLMSVPLVGCQEKIQANEQLVVVSVTRQKNVMHSSACTLGPNGYRIEEHLTRSSVDSKFYKKKPFFRSLVGKKKPVFLLEVCKNTNSPFYLLLTKALNKAQKRARAAHDNARTIWHYQNDSLKLIKSLAPQLSEKTSCQTGEESDTEWSDEPQEDIEKMYEEEEMD